MKRKGFVLALAVMVCLAGAACGEDAQGYWTRNTDLYYHLNEHCAGAQERVPISDEAARAFAKYACHVCVPGEDAGDDVQAAVRGGTIVVKFSDAWLASHELTGVFGWSMDSVHRNAEGWHTLGEYLHGEAYNAFLAEYMQSGMAEGRAYMPDILPEDGALVMNTRHIGSDWYVVVRPKGKIRSKWEMYWRINSLKLEMRDDALRSNFDLQTVEERRELKLAEMNGSEAVFSRGGDGFDIQVYEALDGKIAVIREDHAGNAPMENVRLMIDGNPAGMELSGYTEDDKAVYCCMITDAELDALKGNAQAELWHVEDLNSTAYRVDTGDHYVYYSRGGEQASFRIDKENGSDPADAAFRMAVSGEPAAFAARVNGKPLIYDYAGIAHAAQSGQEGIEAERITPLAWNGETGIFLAEYHKYVNYGVADRLFETGVIYGVRIGSSPEDEWASYLCWLVDENGELIGESRNQAFTIFENGQIHMENLNGEIAVHNAFRR